MSDAVQPEYERRIRAVLAEDRPGIPVLLGLCGSGRTSVLHRVQRDLGIEGCQYVNVERSATTPERFLQGLRHASPFRNGDLAATSPATPRGAFEAMLDFLAHARRPDGAPATFLLDEVLEFRTFENFPGVRHALPELLAALSASANRFVLASRYVTRAERAMGHAAPFVVVAMEALAPAEVERMMARVARYGGASAEEAAALASLTGRLCGGRPALVRALVDTMAEMQGVDDPVAALAAAMEPEGRIAAQCHLAYELRLHRARGYGALKAVLDILAAEEPLTLTGISRQLGRTPGSTKDYLSWLEDVDLVAVHRKRYRFRDPLMRVWVRLHCRPCPPPAAEVAREAQAYAAACGG